MGVKLSELEIGSPITLRIMGKNQDMQMDAVITRVVRDNVAVIDLNYDKSKKLVFDSVQVDMEYEYNTEMPILWRNVKIVNYQSEYVMQTATDGVRHNRRNYFRVGVSVLAQLGMVGNGPRQVMMKDVSLSGFSITDRSKELKISKGEKIAVRFQDLGYTIDLAGKAVRIEEREDALIYGFRICNVCKDLSEYINVKQRRKN